MKTQRALKDEEVTELLRAADDETRDIWIIFIESGLRKNELATLRWDDVDLDQAAIHVRAEVAKSNKSRTIPMRANVKKIFQRLFDGCHSPTDLIFPMIRGRGFYSYVLQEFDKDLEAAGIEKEGIHIHALRRTFATRLIKAGADPKSVQTLLGHSTLELTLQLYTDAKAMDLRGWMDKLPDLVHEQKGPYLAAG